MGDPDPFPRLLWLPPQPTPVKSGVDVMIISDPWWGLKEERVWPVDGADKLGNPLAFWGGGVDEFDEEFTGEGSPWISVEAPVVAIKVGHTWAQWLSMWDKI